MNDEYVIKTNRRVLWNKAALQKRSSDSHYKKVVIPLPRDKVFTSARDALKAARKQLKSEGKGNKPIASDALEPADVEQLWSTGTLGTLILQTIW